MTVGSTDSVIDPIVIHDRPKERILGSGANGCAAPESAVSGGTGSSSSPRIPGRAACGGAYPNCQSTTCLSDRGNRHVPAGLSSLSKPIQDRATRCDRGSRSGWYSHDLLPPVRILTQM